MPQAGHLTSNPLEVAGINRGNGHTLANARIGQHRAPWIDNKGMSVALAAPIMQPRLGWRQ